MINLDAELRRLLGKSGWLSPPDCRSWQKDWLDRVGEAPLGVARPTCVGQVSQIVKLCRAAGVPLVPQGGNTGLVAGGVLGEPGGVILSLSKMDKISDLDTLSAAIEVEAGVVLGNLHQYLKGTGLMFPMRLGSEGSAQVGGLISTNAGGSHAFRYGMMQDLVLGLEIVLPDGSIWNGLRRVQKDNAGYQLRKLFCGAEGTLGVVTKAIIRLAPEPVDQVTALLAVEDLDRAARIGSRCRTQAGDFLSGIEFFSDLGLEMVLDHIPSLKFPLPERSPFYLLIELSTASSQVPLDAILTDLIEWGLNSELIRDGVLASSESQRSALWSLREEQPEGQRLSGPQLKHDISVPPSLVGDFVRRAAAVCNDLLPGVRINPFGHLGDGNLHYNLSPPVGAECFAGRERDLAVRLGAIASELDGSFAAEHGLGRTKIWLADQLRSPVERRLMKAIKHSIDEVGVLNPNAILQA